MQTNLSKKIQGLGFTTGMHKSIILLKDMDMLMKSSRKRAVVVSGNKLGREEENSTIWKNFSNYIYD